MKSIYLLSWIYCKFLPQNYTISTGLGSQIAKKSKLRWIRLPGLFSIRSLYHMQKQCGVPAIS